MATDFEGRPSLGDAQSKWLWQILTGKYVAPRIVIDNGSGTAITSFGGSGGTAMTDDAPFTVGTSSVTPIGATYRSTLDSVDDGDIGAVAMLANRILMTHLVDATGATASLGGGTEYTEDAAAAANPVGKALIGVRADALAGLTTADGDNVAARMTDKGELYVKHVDAIPVTDNGGALTVDGTVAVTNASLTTIAGAVSGTEMQVDVLTIAAGDNNIGNVDIASIAAGDNNIGNVDVVTLPAITGTGTFAVQESGGALTALQLIDNIVNVVDGALGATPTGVLGLAIRDDALAALTPVEGDAIGLRVDANGALWVIPSGTVAVSLASVPSHAVTNAGTFAVQVDGNALTALQLIDDPVIADDAAFTPATSKVMMAGFEADETATDSVDEGDGGAARMTLDRKQIVTIQPHTAGGLSIFRTLDLDETEEDVKTSAGQVYWVHAINTTNALLYLKFYNATAANVTVGSTTPVLTLPVPANNDTDGAGFTFSIPQGLAFSTAICVAATTGLADADTGAPGANALVVNIGYA